MNTPILLGVSAVMLVGAAEASAETKGKSPETIPCAQDSDTAIDQCSYQVKRGEDGKTTVTVTFANSFKRELFFEEGKFVRANVTMSGVGTDTDWSVRDGTHVIRVERQRYEVPNSLIEGD